MRGHVVMEGMSRPERKLLLRAEARARSSGDWGPWEKFEFPHGTVGAGWSRHFTAVHKNRVFSVLDGTRQDGTRHLAVTSLSQERPSWWEMQRIKNEIAGEDATAIEVYPPQSEAVDGADMFHIWVLPSGLTFGLRDNSEKER